MQHEEVRPVAGPIYRIPITAMLKRLRLKMAGLQSHRTQCCCCAVGVFAAMFGIFMLSAGICIVLNVTFMEVDTSGLPPNLHNENGKKIVGIILICVAIAFLGLSATVSIMYFTLCSRKSQASRTATSSGLPRQQRHNPTGAASGLDRPQTTLAGNKRTTHMNGVHAPKSHRNSKVNRGRKNVMPRSVLPPHQEEDPEAAKATMELDTANQIRASYRHRHKSVTEHTDKNTGERLSPSAFVRSVPTILVQNDISNDFMERQFNDAACLCDEDSVSNGCSDLLDDTNSMAQISPYSTINSDFLNTSYLREHELGTLRQKALEDWGPNDPSHVTHITSPTAVGLIPEMSSLSTLTSALQGHVLVVKPVAGADLDIPSNPDSVCDPVVGEEVDHLNALPVTSGQHSVQGRLVNHIDQDSRSESRSSFNSAFSLDGDILDPHDQIDRFRRKIGKSLQPDVSE